MPINLLRIHSEQFPTMLDCLAMTETTQRHRNGALWLGLVLSLLGALSSGLTFIGFPAAAVPWISLVLPIIGVVLVLLGLWRAFRQSSVYRGKIAGAIVAVVALIILAASVAFFSGARRLPRSTGAPSVGQRVPDFTLPDSTGKPVSLSQLFEASAGGAAPKAVLLVFYRGYW